MATGNTLMRFPFVDFEIPTANAPRKSDRGGNPCFLFNDTTKQFLNIRTFMPDAWDNAGNFVVTLVWSSAQVTGDCVWNVQWATAASNTANFNADALTAAFAAVQAATTTTSSTSGRLNYTTITFTPAQADTPLVGSMSVIRISRDAANAADTLVGDAEFYTGFVKQA